jgi:hypothetical protein
MTKPAQLFIHKQKPRIGLAVIGNSKLDEGLVWKIEMVSKPLDDAIVSPLRKIRNPTSSKGVI